MWRCPNRRSRPLPKNPEPFSLILMSIYKVYVSTSVIFGALWNHLGHPLPNTQEAPSPVMQDISKVLDVVWRMQILDFDVLIQFAQFTPVSMWKCPNRRARLLPKNPEFLPPCF
jgi:hypothetical protein